MRDRPGVHAKVSKRTGAILLAGLLLLVAAGGGAVYLRSRASAPAATPAKMSVYYAVTAVNAGTAATSAVAEGAIRTRSVVPADRPPNAVTDPSQFAGRVSAAAIPAGVVITTEMFPAPQTRIGTVVIPAGERALALELAPIAGVAGFAGAGDRIDVYGVAKGAGGAAPAVRLVLQGVEVLSVNGVGLTAVHGQPGSPNLIYLLAVTPVDAERLIYLNEFEEMYFDLAPKGEAPVKTPGTGPAGALAA